MSDRKYRQRGYQDEERRSSGPSSPGPPTRDTAGPSRGRGLGRPEREVFRCRDCGQEVESTEVEPSAVCARCGAALHACVQCRFFDPSARWECRAPIPAPIRSKTKANECEHYGTRRVLELGGERPDDDPRSAFDALFR